jgi:hypothetical protein
VSRKGARVFKVEGRWWWWCYECWGGIPARTSGPVVGWRAALRDALAHVGLRHRPAPALYVSEPPC